MKRIVMLCLAAVSRGAELAGNAALDLSALANGRLQPMVDEIRVDGLDPRGSYTRMGDVPETEDGDLDALERRNLAKALRDDAAYWIDPSRKQVNDRLVRAADLLEKPRR